MPDQSGLGQDFEMLGDGRPADRQLGREIADGERTVGQTFDDCQPGRIAQRSEGRACVSSHER